MTLFQLSYLLLWALAILLVPISVVLVYLLAQLESQFKREGTGHGNNLVGRMMPVFPATNAATGAVESGIGYPGHVHVILALSAGCNSCRALMRELAAKSTHDLKGIRLLVLCMGEEGSCREAVSGLESIPVYIHAAQLDATADLWLVGFPAALVVNESGVVVDVRHPLSVKGVLAAVNNATFSDRFESRHRDAAALNAGVG